MKLIGYHGTSSNVAETIKKHNFKHSIHGWLGKGIYFFNEDLEMAKYFPTRGNKMTPENVGVIECEIEISDDLVLDATNPLSEDMKLFHVIRTELIHNEISKNRINAKSKSINKEKVKSDLDGIVYDILCKKEGFCLVKANTYTYSEIERQYEKIFFTRVPNSTELCLKDEAYIINKNRVV